MADPRSIPGTLGIQSGSAKRWDASLGVFCRNFLPDDRSSSSNLLITDVTETATGNTPNIVAEELVPKYCDEFRSGERHGAGRRYPTGHSDASCSCPAFVSREAPLDRKKCCTSDVMWRRYVRHVRTAWRVRTVTTSSSASSFCQASQHCPHSSKSVSRCMRSVNRLRFFWMFPSVINCLVYLRPPEHSN